MIDAGRARNCLNRLCASAGNSYSHLPFTESPFLQLILPPLMISYRPLTIVALLAVCLPANAQVRKFPYKARIIAAEVYVRSGPGEQYYPTSSLKKGTVVTVGRHDPGGWYKIQPPEGSFSWIPQRFVQQTSAGTGAITEDNVIAFVGSSFGDETHVWQRKLMSGDEVRILGQREVDTHSGSKPMYRIAPPDHEYRWIPGAALIPDDEQARAAHDRDPFAVPSHIKRRTEGQTSPETLPPPRYTPSHTLAKLQNIREEQKQLREIDQRFRSMILSRPADWDLDQVEADYRTLQESATHKPIAGQIDLRYPAIRRYRQRKAKLDELNELTSATDRTDATLMARQYGIPNSAGQPDNGNALASNDFSPFTNSFAIPSVAPGPTTVSHADNSPATTVSATQAQLNIPARSRYIGAGYLRKGTTPEAPWLLTTKSGKVLAQLTPDPSVNLDEQEGQAVGLHGSRYFDEKIKTDR
ncbi:MAG TPA: hypothetical protein DCG12_23475, partial [Planctomycetaceae bacterium]|nr:hypothetical protein [Planctomycetaceae bacterium]